MSNSKSNKPSRAEALKKIRAGASGFELIPATKENATLKVALFGFPGSGKTFTATAQAIGLQKHIKSEKPLGFLDSEGGSDFVLPHFEANGIKVVRAKTRAFAALREFLFESEKICDLVIIDSMTHFWTDLCDSYRRAMNRDTLQFQDWNVLKPEWTAFMKDVLNSPLHIWLLGRAGFEYNYETDPDSNKKILVKTGTKMRAEGQTQYEPHLTIEMENLQWTDEEYARHVKDTKWGKAGKVSARVSFFQMTILKDRANVLSGARFIYHPTPGEFLTPDSSMWTDIRPFVDILDLGATQGKIDDADSVDMFPEKDRSVSQYYKQRDTVLEEIQNNLVLNFPSTSGADKVSKLLLVEAIFKTTSWKRLETLKLEDLEIGRNRIAEYIRVAREGGEAEMIALVDAYIEPVYPAKEDPARLFQYARTGLRYMFDVALEEWARTSGSKQKEIKETPEDIEAGIEWLRNKEPITADDIEELLRLTEVEANDASLAILLNQSLDGAREEILERYEQDKKQDEMLKKKRTEKSKKAKELDE